MAVLPPVRISFAVSTCMVRSWRYLRTQCLNVCSRFACTIVFRRVPPPSPAPRDFALSVYLMPNSTKAAAISLPSFGSHAVQTDLNRDTSIPISSIIWHTSSRTPTSISFTASRLAVISAERSSTYGVGMT
jgi:hypothetical protein